MGGISRKLSIMLLTAAALALSCGSTIAADYTIIDLGAAKTQTGTSIVGAVASGLNNNGDVVGWAVFSGGSPYAHAALWQNGKVTDLGALGPNLQSEANFISDTGLIVGMSYSATTASDNTYRQAAIFSVGNSPVNLHNSMNFDANNSSANGTGNGLIFGHAYDDSVTVHHAIVWTDGTANSAVDINPSWAKASNVQRINSKGQMAGWATPTTVANINTGRATIWDTDGTARYLYDPNWIQSGAVGINDAGQVLVEFRYSNGLNNMSIGIWDGTDGTSGVQMIANPYGWAYAGANSMNNHGQFVGNARDVGGSGAEHAFLWDNGTAIDLEALLGGQGWTLENAYNINEKGQILVDAKRANGERTTLFLAPTATPTPIPAALPLFASGLAALGFIRRRRA